MPAATEQRETVPAQMNRRVRRWLWDYGPMGILLRLRPPVPMLQPHRYAVYLRALAERRQMPGAILEVGCFRGATAGEAARMLKLWDAERPYVCVDTFRGFVPRQFEADERVGTDRSLRSYFDHTSRRSVERTFRHLGVEIEVIEGDIATVSDDALPPEISVCLIDVDLRVPVYEALRRVLPRMLPGGIILVDDCEKQGETAWPGARVGYERFINEAGLVEKYDADFGVIEIPP